MQGNARKPLLKATWEHRSTAHILKDKCGKGPKVATCEASFCKISAKFGFLAHFWEETRPPSKGHLRQSGQNPRNNEIFSPKMVIYEAHFGKISAKPGF